MKQSVFRTVGAQRSSKHCRCGKCAKVQTILESPLGSHHTEEGLRRLDNRELVRLAVGALGTRLAERARHTLTSGGERLTVHEPPDGYDLAGLAKKRRGEAARNTKRRDLSVPPDGYDLEGLKAQRPAQGGVG